MEWSGGKNVEVFCGHSEAEEKCVVLKGVAGRVSLRGRREIEKGNRQWRRGE